MDYEKIKVNTLKDIKLLLRLNQTKVFEEGIKLLNFSQVCKLTHWLNPTMIFLKSLASDFHVINEPMLNKLQFNSPEQLYMTIFLISYFKPNIRTHKNRLRSTLLSALAKQSNIVHQITLLKNYKEFTTNKAIYSKNIRFVRQIFPDFFWDPIYLECVSPTKIKDFFIGKGLEIEKFSQEMKEKIFNLLDKKRYTFEGLFFLIIDSTNEFLMNLKTSLSEIDDFFKGFLNYLKLCIPEEYEDTYNAISFFRILLELSECQPFKKINYASVKKRISEKISNSDVDVLMEKFIFEKKGIEFNEANPDLFKEIYSEYLNFIPCAGIYQFGSIYTGFFFIWHSFLSLTDQIQSNPKYRVRKGQLLENYVQNQFHLREIESYKLILRNNTKDSSENFKLMKDQIRNYPKENIIELDIAFPPDFNYSFNEIDLVYKVDRTLILVEIKSTHVQIDELNFATWSYFQIKSQENLKRKRDLISKILPSLKELHVFFENIEEIKTILLKTEGLIFEGEEDVLTFLDHL